MKRTLCILSILSLCSVVFALEIKKSFLEPPKLTESERIALGLKNQAYFKMLDEDGLRKKTVALREAYKKYYGDEQRDILVEGAQYIDLFEPIPDGKISSNTWGIVVPRNIENGLEDNQYSYWGGNILKGDDSKFHMFVMRWPENIYKSPLKQGHNMWAAGRVVHAISDNLFGPYKVLDEICKGFNPEVYRKKDGSYILAVTHNNAYKSKNINGPWERIEATFKFINRPRNLTNRTYVIREDGSALMLNKEGQLFISKNADEQFEELDVPEVYKRVYTKWGTSGEEDPVMWKDDVNYNVIVNSPYIPEAYYFTSEDGLKWHREEGIAYNNKIVKHKDGTSENWRWLERPRVFTDEYGRVISMNFAAIDVLKQFDLAGDNHSSKNIIVPMNVNKRLELINSKDDDILKVKIISEDVFLPINDVDVASLKFGNFTAVNFGKGAKALKSYSDGNDLIVEFNKKDSNLNDTDYKAKMLGKLKSNKLMWGKVKL